MQRVIYFIRHGQTDWNAQDRLQGQADTPLNDFGRGQARRNGELLRGLIAKPDAFDFVSSPMSRTRETMELVREAIGLPRAGYRTDPRLVELHFGKWQGHTFPELEAADPGCFARRQEDKWNFVPPGDNAESYAALAARIAPWLAEARGDTVCVTHGGVMRTVLRLACGVAEAECAMMMIPQDRVLRLTDGVAEWL